MPAEARPCLAFRALSFTSAALDVDVGRDCRRRRGTRRCAGPAAGLHLRSACDLLLPCRSVPPWLSQPLRHWTWKQSQTRETVLCHDRLQWWRFRWRQKVRTTPEGHLLSSGKRNCRRRSFSLERLLCRGQGVGAVLSKNRQE